MTAGNARPPALSLVLAAAALEAAANATLGGDGRARLLPFAGRRADVVSTQPALRLRVVVAGDGSVRLALAAPPGPAVDAAGGAAAFRAAADAVPATGAAGGAGRPRPPVAGADAADATASDAAAFRAAVPDVAAFEDAAASDDAAASEDAVAFDDPDAALRGDLPALAGYFAGTPEGAAATASGDDALLAALAACVRELPESLLAPLAPLLGGATSAALSAGLRAGGAAAIGAGRRLLDAWPGLVDGVARMASRSRD
jgi:hypothetical protein